MMRDPAQARSWCGDSLPCSLCAPCPVMGGRHPRFAGQPARAPKLAQGWPPYAVVTPALDAQGSQASLLSRSSSASSGRGSPPRRVGPYGNPAGSAPWREAAPTLPPPLALPWPPRARAPYLSSGLGPYGAAGSAPAAVTPFRGSRGGMPGVSMFYGGRPGASFGPLAERVVADSLGAPPRPPPRLAHIDTYRQQHDRAECRLARSACRATARALRRSRTRAQPLQDVCAHQSQPETPKERVIKLRGPLCALWACARALRECEREAPRASNASAHAPQARTTRRTRSCCRPRRRGCCRACAACWPRPRPRRCWAPPPRVRASRSAPRPPPRL